MQRAAQAGVGKIIVPATEAENFARDAGVSGKISTAVCRIGLASWYVGKHIDVSLDQLQQALERHPAKVVAVGRLVWISLATIRNLRGSSGYSTNN
ncbi:hypothetical protein OIU92_12780 [Escherichia coli]|nr:hypothetical protein [Escherichia coli]